MTMQFGEVDHPEYAKVRAQIQPLIDLINTTFEAEGQRTRASFRGRKLMDRLYRLKCEHRRQIGLAMKPLLTAVAIYPPTHFIAAEQIEPGRKHGQSNQSNQLQRRKP